MRAGPHGGVGPYQCIRCPRAETMEGYLSDVVGDVLESLHLCLPMLVHHPGEYVDGGVERVEPPP